MEQLFTAIRSGDIATLERLLDADPAAVHARPDGMRTLLHIATDWPGHFPNVRQTILLLAARGADVNARMKGPHSESPLHWAASSDDVEAVDALLDSGADIEQPGSVAGGGPPLWNAVIFRQWNAGQRLVERGARTTIWQAAALGLLAHLERHCAAGPSPRDITNAFWNACNGGRPEAARYLLARGAEINWTGHDNLTPLGAAIRAGHPELAAWLREQGAV